MNEIANAIHNPHPDFIPVPNKPHPPQPKSGEMIMDDKDCSTCYGLGMVTRQIVDIDGAVFGMQEICPDCGGSCLDIDS